MMPATNQISCRLASHTVHLINFESVPTWYILQQPQLFDLAHLIVNELCGRCHRKICRLIH
jgi:hypothetical protein